MTHNNEPRIYVSTYHKYNDGNLNGAWLTLTDYDTHEDFMQACRELHADEEYPELMYQDYTNFPEAWYDESTLTEETFDKILEFAELDEDQQEAVTEYLGENDSKADIQNIIDLYCGQYSSLADYAEQTAEIPAGMGRYAYYIDWEKYARDLQYDGFVITSSGHVFYY